jgi:tetratricopeptide (TPR) repeat protein
MAVLLVLVTMALYWPVTGHDFVNYDDGVYVYENARVQNGLTWENIRWALTTLHFGLWHPLTWVSHMLDCQCFGLRPGWHHLTSLLLHAANTVLLFAVLRRMTGARWRSAMVAVLFALHPLHVESVAWASERKDVLSTLFLMLTLWAYGRYTERSAISRQWPAAHRQASETPAANNGLRITHHASRITHHGSPFYLLALLFFALGLMSKPMVVTLPLILLLLDYWPLRRCELAAFVSRPTLVVRLLLEKLPFVLLALVTGLITLHGGHRVGSLPSAAQCPIPDRIANATLSYARYFLQAFWPDNLAVFYPFPATFSVWSVAGAALLLLGISVTAFCLARRWPYVIVGWLWYLVTLLPVIGLIQLAAYSHADRYTYVPLIGVFLAFTWGAYELTRHWHYGVVVSWVAASMAIVLCLALTRQQLGHWQNSETLFRHALEVTENNYLAHKAVGDVLALNGQTDEALSQYQEAIRLSPDYADAHYNLGTALSQKGQTDEAIPQFQDALRLNPGLSEAHNSLGAALLKKGQTDEALGQFQEALRLKPDNAEAHSNLGNVLAQKGQTDEALGQFQEALRLKPDNAEAHSNLGNVLAQKGQTGEALSQYQEALRLKPDFYQPHLALAQILLRLNRPNDAAFHMEEFLRTFPTRLNLVFPNDPIRAQAVCLLNDLAWSLATNQQAENRDGARAVRFAERACELTQYRVTILVGTLAAAYAEAGRFPEAVTTAETASTLATLAGDQALLAKNQRLLELYRAGQPYRESIAPQERL